MKYQRENLKIGQKIEFTIPGNWQFLDVKGKKEVGKIKKFNKKTFVVDGEIAFNILINYETGKSSI